VSVLCRWIRLVPNERKEQTKRGEDVDSIGGSLKNTKAGSPSTKMVWRRDPAIMVVVVRGVGGLGVLGGNPLDELHVDNFFRTTTRTQTTGLEETERNLLS